VSPEEIPVPIPLYPRAYRQAVYAIPHRDLLALGCLTCGAGEQDVCRANCAAARDYVMRIHGAIRTLVEGPCLFCGMPQGLPCRGALPATEDYGATAPAIFLAMTDEPQVGWADAFQS
jgi:hypothetical protein